VVVPGQRTTLAEIAPGLQDGAVLHVVELAEQLVESAWPLGEQRRHALGQRHR
jgi:hypothetical protein